MTVNPSKATDSVRTQTEMWGTEVEHAKVCVCVGVTAIVILGTKTNFSKNFGEKLTCLGYFKS